MVQPDMLLWEWWLGLNDRKTRFLQMRNSCEIIVKKHAFRDYPERGFSKIELISLILRVGRIEENTSTEAIENSFLFFVKDDLNRECKLVVLIENVEIDDETAGITKNEALIICSAYRKV